MSRIIIITIQVANSEHFHRIKQWSINTTHWYHIYIFIDDSNLVDKLGL